MILDPHAESIDQNSNHNPSSKVFAVHDLPESITHQPPKAHDGCCGFAQPETLFFGLPAVSSVPVAKILGELIHTLTVRVSGGVVALCANL